MSDNDSFPDNLTEVNDWLEKTQADLHSRWHGTTRHGRKASHGTWACEIANRCRSCNEHLSLPCSLLQEANEIAVFLDTPCYVDDPLTFFRLYLIVLSEFVNQLQDVAQLIGIAIGKPPPNVTIWANRWAKHRLHFLVQHHPGFIFADGFEDDWGGIVSRLHTHSIVDQCGTEHPIVVVDYDWLANAKRKQPDLGLANDDHIAILAVPPLMTFLDSTISYFREFVDSCVHEAEKVKQFESAHYKRVCWRPH